MEHVCKVRNIRNELIFTGSFDECSAFCTENFSDDWRDTAFIVHDGYTEFFVNEKYTAQIYCAY